MKCQVCDSEIAADASFCPHCGAKLKAGEASSAPPPQAAPQVSAPQVSAPQPAPAAPGVRGRIVDVPEETLWEGSYSPKAMLGTIIGVAVASLALAIVALAFVGPGPLRLVLLAVIPLMWIAAGVQLAANRLGIHYKLTNHMFYHQSGLITRVTDRIELIEVHDVICEQGPLNRLVGVGQIRIASNDRTHPVFRVTGVENVQQVFQLIDKARRDEQVRRGRRIESIGVQGA